MSILRFRRRFPIFAKLAVAFVGLSTLPVLAMGYLGTRVAISLLEGERVESLEEDIQRYQARVERYLRVIESDFITLISLPSFASLRQEARREGSEATRHRRPLEHYLQGLLQSGKSYVFVRYVDRWAGEILRVESWSPGKVEVLKPRGMETPGLRFYDLLLSRHNERSPILVPSEYKGPQGQRRAVLLYLHAVPPEDGAGYYLAGVDVQAFLDILAPEHERAEHALAVVDGDGHYLLHPASKRGWDRLLAEPQRYNLHDELGADVAELILAKSSGVVRSRGDMLLAHAPLLRRATGLPADYFVFESVPRSRIAASVLLLQRNAFTLAAIVALVALGLSLLATRRFVIPIRQLARDTDRIAGGNFEHSTQIATNDELEDLAGHINAMSRALALREREQKQLEGQIRSYSQNLEAMVAQRTADLEQEREKLRFVLDHIPVAILLYDGEGILLSASRATARVLGAEPQDVVDRPVGELPWGKWSAPLLREALSEGWGCEDTRRVTAADGGERWLIHHVESVRSLDGRLYGLEVVRDISGERRLQQSLVQAARLATTGEMAAVIAHEVRNSLSSFKLILQLLQGGEVDDRPGSAEVACRAVERIEQLVAQLLSYARPAPLQLQQLDLNRVAEEALTMARPMLQHHGSRIVFEAHASELPVKGDPERLREALVNLLFNAAQAGDHDAHVRMSTFVSDRGNHGPLPGPGDIRTSLGEPDLILTSSVGVLVEDDGPGIPEEKMERIFDPFFTTKLSGTGLGLTMVGRVVMEHHARIDVWNRPQGGAAFALRLPREEVSAPV